MHDDGYRPERAGSQGLRRVFSAPPLLRPWQVALFLFAIAALLKLIAATADEADDDGLLKLGLWVLGLGGLIFLPMWSEVVIDAAARRVHERLGWFRWAIKTTSPADDFEQVAMVRKTTRRHEVTGAPGATFSNVRTWRDTEYRLLLRRPHPFHEVNLPLPRAAKPAEIEAMAAEVAALGGWPLRRPDDPA